MPSRGLLLFACLWLGAIVPGLIATHDLQWPYDHDGFRDVALAQKAADGRWLADPYYKGETLWYSPLSAWLVGATSKLTGVPAPRAFIIAGQVLHLFIPLAFFVCARRLVGQWPALVAAGLFLFLPGRAPGWAAATYSPWLFPSLTAQLFLYSGLAAWLRVLDRPSPWFTAIVGLLLGLSVLTHMSAGALLAAIVAVTAFAASAWTPPAPLQRRAGSFAVTVAIGFVVATPLLMVLASRYGAPAVNRAPATWVYELAEPDMLVRSWLKPGSWWLLLAGAWGARIVLASTARVRMVLAAWGFAALVGFVYCLAAERSERLPAILPAYHFLFQLRAWQWILVGLGLTAAAQTIAARLTRSGPRWFATELAACVLVLSAAVAVYPRYLRREAFVEGPRVSRELAQRTDLSGAYRYLRASTPYDAVVLASDIDAMLIVGPSGRHAVCVGATFSNPSVDVAARCGSRDALLDALGSGREAEALRLAADLGATHVLARGDAADAITRRAENVARPVFSVDPRPGSRGLQGLSDEPLTIFEIRQP